MRSTSSGCATVTTGSKRPPWTPSSTFRDDSIPTCSSAWLGAFVVDDAHAEAIGKLGTILGLEIAVKALEDLNREQASDVEVFQDNLPVPAPKTEAPLLVVTADCKGVPLVRKAIQRVEGSSEPSGSAGRDRSSSRRRARARRRTRSRWRPWERSMTIEPFVRTADDVIEELMRKEARQRRPRPRINECARTSWWARCRCFCGWLRRRFAVILEGINL